MYQIHVENNYDIFFMIEKCSSLAPPKGIFIRFNELNSEPDWCQFLSPTILEFFDKSSADKLKQDYLIRYFIYHNRTLNLIYAQCKPKILTREKKV